MTDLQIIKEILNKRNVKFKETVQEKDVEIVVPSGYVGFFSVITFDKYGGLTSIEAYE